MKIVILLLSSFLMSCDVLLDQALDCINNDRPQFDQGTIPTAQLNQVYSANITASINNNNQDSRYNYAIGLSGALPEGVTYSQERGSRSLVFSGTPVESGVYRFQLQVIATSADTAFTFGEAEVYIQSNAFYNDGDNLCESRHEQDYELTVTE